MRVQGCTMPPPTPALSLHHTSPKAAGEPSICLSPHPIPPLFSPSTPTPLFHFTCYLTPLPHRNPVSAICRCPFSWHGVSLCHEFVCNTGDGLTEMSSAALREELLAIAKEKAALLMDIEVLRPRSFSTHMHTLQFRPCTPGMQQAHLMQQCYGGIVAPAQEPPPPPKIKILG